MRYWEACEAQVTAEEAIEECRIHQIEAIVRDSDSALVMSRPVMSSLIQTSKPTIVAPMFSVSCDTDQWPSAIAGGSLPGSAKTTGGLRSLQRIEP